jgi:Arc/MetJ-type ribon-helix-helix transcriptional regulator
MYRRKGLNSKISRVTVILTEEQQDIIDDIRKKIRKSNGARLSQSEIIRAAVNYAKKLNISFSDVKDEQTLLQAMVQATLKIR